MFQETEYIPIDGVGMYRCDVCDYQTYKRTNFYKHKKKHVGECGFGNHDIIAVISAMNLKKKIYKKCEKLYP